MSLSDHGLGRKAPTDWKHVEKYPFGMIAGETVQVVNKTTRLPRWFRSHSQGSEGSCVGHGVVMERALTNSAQNRLVRIWKPARRYSPLHVWNEAKKIDEWPDTNPGDSNGTSVRAAYQVTVDQGLRIVEKMEMNGLNPVEVGLGDIDLSAGVQTYRWATTVDEVRTAFAEGAKAVTIGVNWYRNAFDAPKKRAGKFWLPGAHEDWGPVHGGHAFALYGAIDRLQAFAFVNSWGSEYPLTLMPYSTLQRLMNENGEVAIVTDR